MESSLDSLLGVLERERQDKTGSDVYLNVYDMVGVSHCASVCLLRVYRCGSTTTLLCLVLEPSTLDYKYTTEVHTQTLQVQLYKAASHRNVSKC